MSNMMPFIMSSPPPIDDCENEDDDEFGDFSAADNNFCITDLNQTSDSPEIEKTWKNSSTINIELPGTSSTYIEREITSDSSAELVENHTYLKSSSGFICEAPKSLCSENENTKGENILLQPVLTNSCSLEAQVEEINLNCQSVTNDNSGEDKRDSLNVGVTEKVDSGGGRTEKHESDIKNVRDIRNEILDVVADDFSEFADFTSGLSNFETVTVEDSGALGLNLNQSEDEFDDFESAVFTSCDVENKLTVEEILKMMFKNPKGNASEATNTPELSDSLHSCLDDSSSVWGHLKELETSHALSYQWSNSAANKTLLSSLNIDCRNILFGARWNCCVPRFAANLGLNPLEPVKATETTSLPQVSSQSTSGGTEEVVPAAQFDWTSSGLTNPLDASHLTLLDLDFFTKFDDISSSSHAASSFWNHSSLEKENANSVAEEPSMPTVVDTLGIVSVKPIVDEIFGSICYEVIGKEEDESIEPTILHPSISSIPVFDSRKKNEMSSEAYAIVESFPDLSFLSARKLMHAADENMSRWRLRP